MDSYLRKAKLEEVKIVFDMVTKRVKWMDENNIHQWNDTDYLNVYPIEYYIENREHLFVLVNESTEEILCAGIVFENDERWNSKESAFYIHNFVSSIQSPGSGSKFIKLLEELAMEEGISYLRLDSADNNLKLASYYENLGFKECGVCKEGKYSGILRQKKVCER